MRKIKIIQHISLDGIIEIGVPAIPSSFPYGDWSAPYRSPAGLQTLMAIYGDRFDVLLGRSTYNAWTGFWPTAPGPMAERLNAATKFIVTHHPETLTWGPSQGVGSPDLAASIRALKATDGPDLIVCGSSTLTSTLLEHGLAEELVTLVNPVLLGTGKRLFAEGTPARSFTLESSQPLPTGILINVYKIAGPLQNMK